MEVLQCEIGQVSFFDGSIAKIVLSDNVKKNKRKHRILICDMSGSMSWAVNRLKEDVINFVDALSEDNYVSIIIFSGHNEARLIGGPTQCSTTGKGIIAAAVKSRFKTLSTTVFSEALKLAMTTANSLLGTTLQNEAVLFTDGCPIPTKWGESVEIRYSEKTAEDMNNIKLSCFGYGNYYNQKFLESLVLSNGDSGVIRHIDEIDNFGSVLKEIQEANDAASPLSASLSITTDRGEVGLVLRTTPQVKQVGNNGLIVFESLYDGQITLFARLPKGASTIQLAGVINEKSFTASPKATSLSKSSELEATLAAAAWAFNDYGQEESSKLLLRAGQEELSFRVANACTIQERYSLNDEMLRIFAGSDITRRYIKKNRIGKGEAACVINILRKLVEEDCSVFIPKGNYEKTGVTTVEEGMRHKPSGKMKVYEISANEKRYNFIMKTVVEVEELKDGKWVDGTRNRDYVVIKDGNLHIKKLEAYLTNSAFNFCQNCGTIPIDEKFSEQRLYTLDLSELPMIVRSWANPKQLGLVDLMQEELVLEAQQTAINARVKSLRSTIGEKKSYPKRTNLPATDFYTAACFQYELQGFKAPVISYAHIINLEDAKELAKTIRKRLVNVRLIKRLILFAMDFSENKLFIGIPRKPVARSNGKMKQLVKLSAFGKPSLELCRITWYERIDITANVVAATA